MAQGREGQTTENEMKTAKQWMEILRKHNGREWTVTVLESDIADIQRDALNLNLLEEVLELLSELECEWRWKQNEPRAGNQAQYEHLARIINGLQQFLLKHKKSLDRHDQSA